MQPKVSIVITCYNKEEYIGNMFDSIIAQDWDNIELILVNDGSTDGTRAVIAKYEAFFQSRGFEVVIIDQENGGVCLASKVGLMHITGDYVCLLDADDELDSKYASTLAGWLTENPDYDYAACDLECYIVNGNEKQLQQPIPSLRYMDSDDPRLLEKYILHEIHTCTLIYMVRTAYLHKCRIIENYFTETRGSQEPSYAVPLLAFGGKLKYFPLRLYHYHTIEGSHSHQTTVAKLRNNIVEFHRLLDIAINRLPVEVVDSARQRQLREVAFTHKTLYLQVADLMEDMQAANLTDEELLQALAKK